MCPSRCPCIKYGFLPLYLRWQWYAPLELAKVNNSEIEKVTEMGKKNSNLLPTFVLLT